MLSILLQNIHWRGYHGLFAEEKLTGNIFLLETKLDLKETEGMVSELKETVDYGAAYERMKEVFDQPEQLLETLAYKICQALFRTFPLISGIEISIIKTCPPIEKFSGRTGIRLSLKREECI